MQDQIPSIAQLPAAGQQRSKVKRHLIEYINHAATKGMTGVFLTKAQAELIGPLLKQGGYSVDYDEEKEGCLVSWALSVDAPEDTGALSAEKGDS